MQNPGFNIECVDTYGYANSYTRWGYCNNCPDQDCGVDGGDADGSIGIGLSGQSQDDEQGAGWTALFAGGADTCDSDTTHKRVWVSVRRLEGV